MIGGTVRLLEAGRAVPADRQQSIGEAEALLLTNASQPLAKGNRDRGCYALASQLRQFLCHQVSLAVLDIQSHLSTFHRCLLCSCQERSSRSDPCGREAPCRFHIPCAASVMKISLLFASSKFAASPKRARMTGT